MVFSPPSLLALEDFRSVQALRRHSKLRLVVRITYLLQRVTLVGVTSSPSEDPLLTASPKGANSAGFPLIYSSAGDDLNASPVLYCVAREDHVQVKHPPRYHQHLRHHLIW